MHGRNDPSLVTEEYELSRRQARRITAKAMDLIIQDFEEINIEQPKMVAELLVKLEEGMKIANQ